MDEAERSRRVDTLTYQIGELERAQLKPGEDEELDQRRQLLRSAGKLTQAIQAADFALNGDEEQPGACGLIADAEGEVRSAARYSTQMDELAEKLAGRTRSSGGGRTPFAAGDSGGWAKCLPDQRTYRHGGTAERTGAAAFEYSRTA